ncbi:MAG: type II toxin-antitoxin system death-on-curing family toxin [Patescibacteria group bacterium]
MKYIDLEEILRLHFQIITDFGGSHGVRDESRLKSVVEAPKQSVFGQDQYPTIYEKAAVYIRNIVGDHPFADGNKRTAITTSGIFLMRNGYKMTASPKDLEDFAVKVAVDHLKVSEIAKWLEQSSAKS